MNVEYLPMDDHQRQQQMASTTATATATLSSHRRLPAISSRTDKLPHGDDSMDGIGLSSQVEEDREAVRSLPDTVEEAPRQQQQEPRTSAPDIPAVTERIQANRDDRHDTAVAELHVELALIRSRLEQSIRQRAEAFYERLHDMDEDITSMLASLDTTDSLSLTAAQFGRMDEAISEACQDKQQLIDGLATFLHEVEARRMSESRAVLQEKLPVLVAVAARPPRQLQHLILMEANVINEAVAQNLRDVTELITRLMVASTQTEKRWRQQLKRRRQRWTDDLLTNRAQQLNDRMDHDSITAEWHAVVDNCIKTIRSATTHRHDQWCKLADLPVNDSDIYEEELQRWDDDCKAAAAEVVAAVQDASSKVEAQLGKHRSDFLTWKSEAVAKLVKEQVCDEAMAMQYFESSCEPVVAAKLDVLQQQADLFIKAIAHGRSQSGADLVTAKLAAIASCANHLFEKLASSVDGEKEAFEERLDAATRPQVTRREDVEKQIQAKVLAIRQAGTKEALSPLKRELEKLLKASASCLKDRQSAALSSISSHEDKIAGILKDFGTRLAQTLGVSRSKKDGQASRASRFSPRLSTTASPSSGEMDLIETEAGTKYKILQPGMGWFQELDRLNPFISTAASPLQRALASKARELVQPDAETSLVLNSVTEDEANLAAGSDSPENERLSSLPLHLRRQRSHRSMSISGPAEAAAMASSQQRSSPNSLVVRPRARKMSLQVGDTETMDSAAPTAQASASSTDRRFSDWASAAMLPRLASLAVDMKSGLSTSEAQTCIASTTWEGCDRRAEPRASPRHGEDRVSTKSSDASCIYACDASAATVFRKSQIEQILFSFRASVLSQAENATEDLKRQASNTVAQQREQIEAEGNSALVLHRTRLQQIEREVMHVRVVELALHKDRVNQHAAALESALDDLWERHTVFKSGLDQRFNAIVTKLRATTRSLTSIDKTDKLESTNDEVTSSVADFKSSLRRCIQDYRKALDEELVALRQSNAAMQASLKTFSDQGNFSKEELTQYRDILSKLSSATDERESSIFVELDGLEGSHLAQLEQLMNEYQEELVIHRRDVGLCQATTRAIAGCRVRVQAAVNQSNLAHQSLVADVQELKRMLKEHAPLTDMAPVMNRLSQGIGARALYLDCLKLGAPHARKSKPSSARFKMRRAPSTVPPPPTSDEGSPVPAPPSSGSQAAARKARSRSRSRLATAASKANVTARASGTRNTVPVALRGMRLLVEDWHTGYPNTLHNETATARIAARTKILDVAIPYYEKGFAKYTLRPIAVRETIQQYVDVAQDKINMIAGHVASYRDKSILELRDMVLEVSSLYASIIDHVFDGIQEHFASAFASALASLQADCGDILKQILQSAKHQTEASKPMYARPSGRDRFVQLRDKIENELIDLRKSATKHKVEQGRALADLVAQLCEQLDTAFQELAGVFDVTNVESDLILPETEYDSPEAFEEAHMSLATRSKTTVAHIEPGDLLQSVAHLVRRSGGSAKSPRRRPPTADSDSAATTSCTEVPLNERLIGVRQTTQDNLSSALSSGQTELDAKLETIDARLERAKSEWAELRQAVEAAIDL